MILPDSYSWSTRLVTCCGSFHGIVTIKIKRRSISRNQLLLSSELHMFNRIVSLHQHLPAWEAALMIWVILTERQCRINCSHLRISLRFSYAVNKALAEEYRQEWIVVRPAFTT